MLKFLFQVQQVDWKVNIIKSKIWIPVAIVLQPHPQYGGTMNRIVQLMYNILENGFSVIKINFRGVGKSDGVFDNG